MTTKLPSKLPVYLVKCSWRATAVTLKIQAKDEGEAWDKASKKVMKMLGGQWCQDIEVKGVV